MYDGRKAEAVASDLLPWKGMIKAAPAGKSMKANEAHRNR